jgi:hypothetical protein
MIVLLLSIYSVILTILCLHACMKIRVLKSRYMIRTRELSSITAKEIASLKLINTILGRDRC